MVESQDSMYESGGLYDLMQVNSEDLISGSQKSEVNFEEALNFDPVTLINNLCEQPTTCLIGDIDITQFQLANFSTNDHARQLPIMDELKNEWGFEMGIMNDATNKSSWLYSQNLNKVYVKMNSPMNVYPKFTHVDPAAELFIRAMIVFTSQNDLPEPVKKCPNHKEKDSAAQNPDHILICENAGAEYRGSEAGKLFAEKLAVLVPMRNVAANEPLKLTFTCQNSCSGGMNRKSTTLIFTLEDGTGAVLGRSLMHFKVCSCPRRDKEKDESTTKVLPKKRKAEASNAPSTSKRVHLAIKQESSESLLLEQSMTEPGLATTINHSNISGSVVPLIKQEPEAEAELKLLLPSKEIKKKVLDAAYNIVAGEMSRTGHVSYNCYLTEIQKQIDNIQM